MFTRWPEEGDGKKKKGRSNENDGDFNEKERKQVEEQTEITRRQFKKDHESKTNPPSFKHEERETEKDRMKEKG